MAIQAGDRMPSFELPDANGALVRSQDLLGNGPVVVYFYPKDDTPGCKAEACAFRDQYEVFKDAGAEVVGISSDSSSSHGQFARKYSLPFVLLSDTGNRARKAFGVPRTLGVLPGRVTYVIDASGTVQHVFSSQIAATKHVDEALAVVKRLAA